MLSPDQFVEYFREQRASAILRTPLADAAAPAMEAAVRGGFRALEFTMNTPGALELIREFSRRNGLVVGAGTVLDVESARAAVEAGASFLVSPVVDEEVIHEAAALGVAIMPGAFTATEMLRAHRAGAPLQKLFPAPGIGPAYLRALRGPLPMLRIVPTSGVELDNAREWFDAGAHAVGFVSSLFVHDDLANRRFEQIEERARRLLERCS